MEKKPKFKIEDKIYDMAYEKNHVIYTIVDVREFKGHPYVQTGILYSVHVNSDLLPKIAGYYFIHENEIDADNRYFSSPELAHEGYVLWKEKNEEKMQAYEKWKEKTGRKGW